MGFPLIFAPVTVAAGVNDKIDFKASAVTYSGTVAPGVYYSPWELGLAVASAMNGALNAGFWCGITTSPINYRSDVLTDTSVWTPTSATIASAPGWVSSPELAYSLTSSGAMGYHSMVSTPCSPNDRLYFSCVAQPHSSAYNPCSFQVAFEGNSWAIFNLTTGVATTSGVGLVARMLRVGPNSYLCEAYEPAENWYGRGAASIYRAGRSYQIYLRDGGGNLLFTGALGFGVRFWNVKTARFAPNGTATNLGALSLRPALAAGTITETSWDLATLRGPRFQVGRWDGGTVQLLMASGANRLTSIHRELGFPDADYADAAVSTAQTPPWNLWTPGRRPVEDDGPQLESVGTFSQANAGPAQYLEEGVIETREVHFQLPAERMTRWAEFHPMRGFNPYTQNDDQATASLERIWRMSKARFRYWPDHEYPAEFTDYAFDEKTSKGLVFDRPYKGKDLLKVKLKMRRVA